MALSDTAIRNAKPGAKPVRLFDGDGLYLEVAPSGGRWWRLKYRYDNKEKRLSLGTYPDVGLKAARARRDAARKLIAEGIDPSAARQEAKHAKQRDALSTVEAVSRAWLAHRASGWTPGTLAPITASLENHVFPALGDHPIREIAARDIKLVVQAIDNQGSGETAGRVFQRLRAIYRYALSEYLVDADPTYPLKPAEILKPRDVTHRLALAEADMSAFFGKLDAYDGDPSTKAALALGYKGIATAHGFRTLFSTCANEAGWNSDVIETQLSHEERDDVRGAYNRALWLPERVKLMQWWADRPEALRQGKTASSTLPLRLAEANTLNSARGVRQTHTAHHGSRHEPRRSCI